MEDCIFSEYGKFPKKSLNDFSMFRSSFYEHISYSCIPKRSPNALVSFASSPAVFAGGGVFGGVFCKSRSSGRVLQHTMFLSFFLGCRMRFCSRVLTVGRKYQTLAVLRIKKSPHKEDGKAIFCGCGVLVLRFLAFNSRLSQCDFFPKHSTPKRKSDASIREIVINRVYKRCPKAGGVLTTKSGISTKSTIKQ